MYRFIETLCIKNGECDLLKYHQKRVSDTFSQFFPNESPIQLEEIIAATEVTSERQKLRVVYDSDGFATETKVYVPKDVNSLQIVPALIDYEYKYADRSMLDKLYDLRGEADDILILRNNDLTDTYYANIALKKDGQWFTPRSCLLNGVRRQALLATQKIVEAPINIDQLEQYETISLINAMLDLGEVSFPVKNIYY